MLSHLGNRKSHKTASVPAATGHSDQRHWCKKQRGKWEKLFVNSPDGKHYSQSHATFIIPETGEGGLIVIGIGQKALVKLKSPDTSQIVCCQRSPCTEVQEVGWRRRVESHRAASRALCLHRDGARVLRPHLIQGWVCTQC